MVELPKLGVFRCKNCNEAYTKKEVNKLERLKKGPKCSRCGKTQVGEIKAKALQQLQHIELQAGVERFYYWILDKLAWLGYEPEKITDVYTASEASDFWGTIEQRKQLQADQASKYLATIGNMLKNLFQLVRELRIMDERLDYYDRCVKGDVDSDIALKGIWIDRVEGGAQKPTSIYGMATQLGMATLPDYFFNLFVKPILGSDGKVDIDKTLASVNGVVEKLGNEGVNKKVREVLKRKIREFVGWRERTYEELKTGKKFKLRYLRQHYHVMRMYIDWVKPYLRNVRRLQMQRTAPEEEGRTAYGTRAWTKIISAAEGAVIDLDLFGKLPRKATEKGEMITNKPYEFYYPCVRIRFHYCTAPEMLFRQEWQKGAVHTGTTFIDFEGYALTEKDIAKYKQLEYEEDLEVLKSVFSAMDALEKDLKDYLEQADEVVEEKVEKKKGIFESIFAFKAEDKKSGSTKKGRRDKRSKGADKEKLPPKYKREMYKKIAENKAFVDVWAIYDALKKSFGMLRW